ncbi:MAG: ABC transporter permease [Candidatus Colwellbacteria bacterium]|nr:ABC transporter permease [Candidatus Colwellbacteria bacterium]
MKTSDILEETYTALSSNKARSGLTILGIVIGISSVIAMISIGQGAQSSITSRIESIGSNLIMVTPGAQRSSGDRVSSGWGSAQTLTNEDLETLRTELLSVKGVAGELSGRYQVTAKGTNTNTSVIGTTPDYTLVKNLEISSGSFISEQNVKSMSRVAILGPTTVTDLFGEDADPVGSSIRIKGTEFKVIGVTTAKGNSGANNQDDTIYIPLTTAQKLLAGSSKLSTIDIAAADAGSMEAVQAQAMEILLTEHNISDEASADFRVMNQAEMAATASSVTNTLTVLLAAVAGISLIVGGIGIMNMMLTTVTERTREIGLRKAIGAKRKDINAQFLMESVMLTFIGGIIGIALGCAIALILPAMGIIQAKISLTSIILAFGVSALIGIVFGYYPAKRAGSLSPIDALRYE